MALIITIIVLLILAGITISLTIGQRGILNKAQEAGRNYEEAAKREDEELENFLKKTDDIINGITAGNNSGTQGEEAWAEDPNDSNWSKPSKNSKKDNYEDESGKKATIPKGFQVSKKEGETKIEEGLVVREATTQNEYVWIPCTEDGANESIKYDRYAFGSITNVNYTEAMPIIQGNQTELDSIKTYGGFYMGRYEVGIEGYDTNVVTNNSENSTNWTGYTNGRAVVQKGKQVWNYITRDKAKEIAEGLYSDNDAVISRLCSSYAWDTTLKFIETKYPNYIVNSIQGNYKDTEFTYIDLNKTAQIKTNGNSVLVPTGQTTPVNNIYDMGGNAWEWTTEDSSDGKFPYTERGGSCYYYAASDGPVGIRSNARTTSAYDASTFRQTLYIGL